ncbi:DUF294 nucleotidyltransferase-like domain-containing protein [Pontibacter sp. G13]|uniref:DUF294 nucleotidyltransferase-like domain-containing protein n=1 Tax=Pontibacter sp. G13 TaxID=3074898 RepID=UPI00288AE7A2|nr:DUF294 nucleotidyltransferase-like domain-containing protein [Pontibacter sp. G13]WNJ18123.1 DUF294 nucleotidyltransferase-like domain-containing protein [Pontibacter sp. G13]
MMEITPTFLKRVIPFQLLPEQTLIELVPDLQKRSYPADSLIYQQDVTSVEGLCIILSGRVVKFFRMPSGERAHEETFEEGQTFGAISLMLNNQTAIRSVRSLTAVELVILPSERFQQLCKDHPEFYAHFSHEFGKRMLDSGYAQYLMSKQQPQMEESQAFQVSDLAFTQKVEELVSRRLNTCHPQTTIQEAAKSMTWFKRGYVLVIDQDHQPVGIVTDLDLRNKVVAEGKSPMDPVSSIMSSPVLEIDRDAYRFEAILQLYRRRVNHMLVRLGEDEYGMLTLNKLLHAQAKSPFIFIENLRDVESPEGLKKKWDQVPGIIQTLFEKGTRPVIVNNVVSAISDGIARNIIRRAIKQLGPPPAKFSFLVMGSEARREQTLSTDQDNAIIYEDVEPERKEEVRAYFLKLGEKVCDDLNTAGFHWCEGNLMAKNPDWNHSLTLWKSRYEQWIHQPLTNHVLVGVTFFDCRPIYGDRELAFELRSHIFDTLKKISSSFLTQLARISLENKPPLTFLGRLQVDGKPGQNQGVNIKRAMNMISDISRIYSLREGIYETNTGERLNRLMEMNVLSGKEHLELRQGYYFMMRLRLQHQVSQIQRGQEPDNYLPPGSMSKFERLTLKEIFKSLEKIQKRIGVVFAGMMNM